MTELANVTTLLQARAAHIRKLMTGMVNNTLAIGEELEKARETFPLVGPQHKRAGWATWLRNEFQLSSKWAHALIQAHRKFGHLSGAAGKLPSQRVLAYLAQENVPDAARDEAIEHHIKQGKKLSRAGAQKIVQKHLPSPKKANALARETGKPQSASDGYVYFGATDTEAKESMQRRTVVYSVREAVEKLASIKITAQEFLDYAMPHQLWKARDQHEIDDAFEWLQALRKAWERRKA